MANNDNLIPFTGADDPRRMNGKPKGTKHLSTKIRELGEEIDWSKTTLVNKDELERKYGTNGWTALIYVAFTKALTGDTKAMEWLSKNGYGTRTEITGFDGSPLNTGVDELREIANTLKSAINESNGGNNGTRTENGESVS